MAKDKFKFRLWDAAGARYRWREVTVPHNKRGNNATLDDAITVLYRRYPGARVTSAVITYGRSTR